MFETRMYFVLKSLSINGNSTSPGSLKINFAETSEFFLGEQIKYLLDRLFES